MESALGSCVRGPLTLMDLWYALHNSYNSAENRLVNICFLNKISQANTIEWPSLSRNLEML